MYTQTGILLMILCTVDLCSMVIWHLGGAFYLKYFFKARTVPPGQPGVKWVRRWKRSSATLHLTFRFQAQTLTGALFCPKNIVLISLPMAVLLTACNCMRMLSDIGKQNIRFWYLANHNCVFFFVCRCMFVPNEYVALIPNNFLLWAWVCQAD